MAHYALVDDENIVKQVVVIDDAWETNGEATCRNTCKQFFDAIDPILYAGTWIKTSYNNKIRGTFAGIGFTYDRQSDAFVPPSAKFMPASANSIVQGTDLA